MKCKQLYRNQRTHKVSELEVNCDATGHPSMYVTHNGDEWKAVSTYSLNVVESDEFFASAHEYRVKFDRDPLDGSDFGYGLT